MSQKKFTITKKWWFYSLLAGIFLRLILMPITFHPDLWGHSSVAYFFAYQGRLNIYNYLLNLPITHPLVAHMGVGDIFIYPPLTYFTLGIFRLLIRPLENPDFIPMIWSGAQQALSFPMLHWHLFIYKLPYLFLDVGLAFLFAQIFEEKKKLAFALWLFNPLSLYATFMVGQIDILPVFCTVLSLYLLKKKKYDLSLLSLGLGGSYKMYPLLFILPAAFVLGRNLKEKIRYIILGFLPFILTVVPYIFSPAFRSMVLFSPKSTKMLFMGWNVSGSEVIYPFILGITFIYLHSYYAKVKLSIFSYEFIILLLIFSITHYHPQWFLWITPFLIGYLIKNNFREYLLIILMGFTWLCITLFFEPSLSYGLFSPIFPKLANAVAISDLLGKYIDVFQFKSIVRSLFAGSAVYIIYKTFQEKRLGEYF